jgi:hypothetical protein
MLGRYFKDRSIKPGRTLPGTLHGTLATACQGLKPMCESVKGAAAAKAEGSMYAIPKGRDASPPSRGVIPPQQPPPKPETAVARAACGSTRPAA